jgi:replicative DNA helicase
MIEQLPRESEYEALSRFAQRCKKFAEMNDIGLVIVSQINRAGAKEGRPQAHHLQGCGRLEQVCDLLLILYCPYNYDDSSYDYEEGTSSIPAKGMKECPPEYVEVKVAKNKNGMRNFVIKTKFTGKYFKFEPWIDTPKEDNAFPERKTYGGVYE